MLNAAAPRMLGAPAIAPPIAATVGNTSFAAVDISDAASANELPNSSTFTSFSPFLTKSSFLPSITTG